LLPDFQNIGSRHKSASRDTGLGVVATPSLPGGKISSPRRVPIAPLTHARQGISPTGSGPLPAASDTESPRALRIIAFLLVFNFFGRPFEFFLMGLRIPAIICAVAIVLAITYRAFRYLNSLVGATLIAFIGVMAVSTLFSTWKGGSVGYLRNYFQFSVVLMLILAAAPRNLADIRRICYATAIASGFHIIVGGRLDGNGRLNLAGTFGNSDDVALLAGFAIPFVILMGQNMKPVTRILVAFPALVFLVRGVAMTATRAAIPAFLAMILLYMIRGTMAQKVAIMLGVAVTAVLLALALPASVLQRFGTIFDSFDSQAVEAGRDASEAMASVAERKELLQDAVTMILTYPLVGVGPGEFQDYRIKYLRNPDGSTKIYFPSHNTYLQVAAESGLGAILAYVAFVTAVFLTIRKSRKLYSPGVQADWQGGYQICVCLEAAFVYFATCAIFMTCDRHPHQFVVAGLALALQRVSVRDLRIAQSTPGHDSGPAWDGRGFPAASRQQFGLGPKSSPVLS
jgi:O-antigen ligase